MVEQLDGIEGAADVTERRGEWKLVSWPTFKTNVMPLLEGDNLIHLSSLN